MKKFIALFLVFSILALSMPLSANERKGANLIIQKKDGQQVRGELIAVKQTSFLLLERDSGADVTVDIEDISEVTIVKKGEYGKGFLFGSLFGLGIGAVAGLMLNEIMEVEETFHDEFVGLTLISGLAVGVIGILISGLSSKDETIQFEGMPDSTIKANLTYLRKKARVKNAQ